MAFKLGQNKAYLKTALDSLLGTVNGTGFKNGIIQQTAAGTFSALTKSTSVTAQSTDNEIPTAAAVKAAVDGATPVWGNITGTLSNQTDLNTVLTNTSTQIANLNTNKADKTALALTDRNLKYLAELTKGQAWDTEAGTTPAYQHIVASGAKAVAIDMIGGKTEVVSGALVSANVTDATSMGKNMADVSNAVRATTVVSGVDSDGTIHIKDVSAGQWSNSYVAKFYYTRGSTVTLSANRMTYGRLGLSNSPTSYPTTDTNLYEVGGGDNLSSILFYGTLSRTSNIDYDGWIYVYFCTDVRLSSHTTFDLQLQVELGSTATTYSPYIGTLGTYTIPQSLRTAYPLRSAGSVYDEYDIENKKFIQRVGTVDLGTLAWGASSSSNCFYTTFTQYKRTENVPMLCAKYTYGGTRIGSPYYGDDKVLTAYYNSGSPTQELYVHDSAYSDAASFKTAMNGVMLQYELATPTEIDISSYLTEDNVLTVEAGGTLTFTQSNSQTVNIPIPNDTVYAINLSEAT